MGHEKSMSSKKELLGGQPQCAKSPSAKACLPVLYSGLDPTGSSEPTAELRPVREDPTRSTAQVFILIGARSHLDPPQIQQHEKPQQLQGRAGTTLSPS